MSEHHRGAWGALGQPRDDAAAAAAVWWSSDPQQMQHQLAQQHQQQLAAHAAQLQQQQQQQHDLAQQLQQQQEAAVRSAASQQLFSYKMASSFQNPAAAVSSSSFDMNTVNTINTSTAGQHELQQQQQQIQQVQQQVQQQNNQWWYPGGMQNPIPNNTQNTNLNMAQQMMNRGKMPRKADAKPRGRMTAYAFFVQTCREEHKKQHPDENVVFAEFSKKCAERWKTMLDKEKKRFHEMAEKDKKRYDSEMQDYVPPAGEKRGKKRKIAKDPNAPKRSLSAFFWFCNDERGKVKAANPEMTVGEVAKELGRRWSDISPELKNKYEQMAEKDKARYERDMTAYKKKPKGGMPMPDLNQKNDSENDDDDDGEEDE